jgi:hypothetical protein
MATVTFVNKAGGNFGDDGVDNWSTGKHPMAGDTADITDTFEGADYSVDVTDAEGADQINIGAANAQLAVETDAILTVGSIDLTAGTLFVGSGGEITGKTTITAASDATTTFIDGTLDGVTWMGTLGLTDITQASSLSITTGLTVLNSGGSGPGEIDITGLGGATLDFESSMTINGTGGNLQINIGVAGGSPTPNEFITVGSNDVLTLGSNVSVNQTAAASSVFISDQSTGGTLVNDGTMSFTAGAAASAEVNPDSFTNNGIINAAGGILNGESLDITVLNTFINNGLISLTDFARVGISGPNGGETINGTISINGTSTFDLNNFASVGGTGVISLANSSTADLNNDFSGTVLFVDKTDILQLDTPGSYSGTIANMHGGSTGPQDIIDLLNTTVTNLLPVTGTALQGTLVVMNGPDVQATILLNGDYRNSQFSFGTDGNNGTDIFLACFAEGTRVDTPDGPVAVEDLASGDLVLTAGGTSRPVRWIGHRRIDLARHPDPACARPIRVLANAFGPGEPRRELLLSPDHAVFVDDVLIPIKHLLNDVSIRRVPVDAVTYYHIELDEHDVVLAEGLPAESYLDTGDRSDFDNGGRTVALHPHFVASRREGEGCAPLIVTGPRLRAVRDRVNARVPAVAPAFQDDVPVARAARRA